MELTGATLLARTRRLTNDMVSPYYISDEELYEYLSLAETLLAAQGQFLRVISQTLTTVANSPKVALGALPPERVREVSSVELIDTDGTVEPLGIKSFQEFTFSDETGPPTEVTFGRESGYMHLRPIPEKVYSLRVTYTGLPLPIEGESDVPAVPTTWHTYLPYGAALFALSGSEEEHFDPKRLQTISNMWQTGINQAIEARAHFTQDAATVQFNGNGLW